MFFFHSEFQLKFLSPCFLQKPRFPWKLLFQPFKYSWNSTLSLSFMKKSWNTKANDLKFWKKTHVPGFLRGFWTFCGPTSAKRCGGTKITRKKTPSKSMCIWLESCNKSPSLNVLTKFGWCWEVVHVINNALQYTGYIYKNYQNGFTFPNLGGIEIRLKKVPAR